MQIGVRQSKPPQPSSHLQHLSRAVAVFAQAWASVTLCSSKNATCLSLAWLGSCSVFTAFLRSYRCFPGPAVAFVVGLQYNKKAVVLFVAVEYWNCVQASSRTSNESHLLGLFLNPVTCK